MVDASVKYHVAKYEDTGTELILGEGRVIGPRTLEVKPGTAAHAVSRRSGSF
jgi:hypothetical protein